MTVERIPVTDRAAWLKLRERDVTASAVGCLLGIHEYWTPFALWALKTGLVKEDPEESEPMKRGRLLEPVAFQLIQEKHPTWTLTEPKVYLRDPAARLGATPDLFVNDPERGRGVVQVKTVEPSVFRRKWRDEESREVAPPLWIAVQAITEAHLAELSWAAVAAMTVSFGIELHMVPVPIHQGVITRTRGAVANFWKLVADRRQPSVDFARDGALLEELYQPTADILPMESDNALPALVDERQRLSDSKNVAEKRLKEIKAEILVKLAGAGAARIAGDRLITAKRIERAGYSVNPSSYVDVRVRQAKGAEQAS